VGHGPDDEGLDHTAAEVLTDLASNVNSQDNTGHYGGITFGNISPPVTTVGTTAVVSAQTSSSTYRSSFGGVSQPPITTVNIKINDAAGTFVTGTVIDQAVTLLHELGHVMGFLFPLGSSQIKLDDPDSPGGQGQSAANTKLIKEQCFPNPQNQQNQQNQQQH
jgi:hypothetical protein